MTITKTMTIDDDDRLMMTREISGGGGDVDGVDAGEAVHTPVKHHQVVFQLIPVFCCLFLFGFGSFLWLCV